MNTFVSTVTQKNQPAVPVARKVADVAGRLSQYKKTQPVSVEAMDQAVAEYIKHNTLQSAKL